MSLTILVGVQWSLSWIPGLQYVWFQVWGKTGDVKML